MLLCALVWTFAFTLEIAAQSLQLKMLFVKFQFIAITFLPLAWLYLTLSYIGHVRLRNEWVLLSAIPVTTNIIIWLVPQPNWFWKEPRLVLGSAPLSIMDYDYDYGFWFYCVHIPYSYILVFAALIVLVRIFLKTHSIYRQQIMFLIIAILLPTITDIFYVLGYSPIKYFNYTTAVFSISCLIIAWALFRYNFLDLLPMARHAVIENMDDGVIVLDVKNRIVDVNPSAMMITGISTHDVGRPIWEICPDLIRSTMEEISHGDKKQIEIKVGDTDNIRVYDFRLSFIKDRIGRVRGSVVTLRDFTELVILLDK